MTNLLVVFKEETEAILAKQHGLEAVSIDGDPAQAAEDIINHPRASRGVTFIHQDWNSVENLVDIHQRLARAGVTVSVLTREPVSVLKQSGPKALKKEVGNAIEVKFLNGHLWPTPLPLPGLPGPKPFDLDMLPPVLREAALDISERIQVPIDYVAVGYMVTVGAAIGRRVGIRPKQHDNWTVVPNLWGGIIGRPGFMKSPALAEATRPLRMLEKEAAAQYDREQQAFRAHEELMRVRRREIDEELGQAASTEEAEEIIARHTMEPPTRQRFIVNDTTPEKLGEILLVNPDGVMVLRDELAGWYLSLRRAGSEGSRKFYLEAWDGTGGYTYDRIGRGTIDIPCINISIMGTLQPGVIGSIIQEGENDASLDDGLIQRFQLLVWPEMGSTFENIDRRPNQKALDAVYEGIRNLARIDLSHIGAEMDDNEGRGISFLRFHRDVQPLFDAWRVELENRVRDQDSEESPGFISHLCKYRSLLPSLALIYHLLDGQAGPVSREAFEAGRTWVSYLESHARRIYACGDPQYNSLQTLAERVREGKIRDGFSMRDLVRKGWSGLREYEQAEGAIKKLQRLRWVRGIEDGEGGQATKRYYINPRLQKKPNSQ